MGTQWHLDCFIGEGTSTHGSILSSHTMTRRHIDWLIVSSSFGDDETMTRRHIDWLIVSSSFGDDETMTHWHIDSCFRQWQQQQSHINHFMNLRGCLSFPAPRQPTTRCGRGCCDAELSKTTCDSNSRQTTIQVLKGVPPVKRPWAIPCQRPCTRKMMCEDSSSMLPTLPSNLQRHHRRHRHHQRQACAYIAKNRIGTNRKKCLRRAFREETNSHELDSGITYRAGVSNSSSSSSRSSGMVLLETIYSL